jgi:hypothetical protein
VPESSVAGHVSDGSITAIRLRKSATIDLAAVWRRADNRLVADFLDEITQP